MKHLDKAIICTLAILFAIPGSLAQTDGMLGAKAGINISTLTLNNAIDRTGLSAGLFYRSDPVKQLGYQAELLYSTRGADWHVGFLGVSQDVSVRLDYLDLPVMLVYRPLPVLELHGGAYAGYLLSAGYSATGILINETGQVGRGNFKQVDLGALLGLAMNIGPVQLGGRYNFGLTRVSDSFVTNLVLGDAHHRFAQLYAAYIIPVRR